MEEFMLEKARQNQNTDFGVEIEPVMKPLEQLIKKYGIVEYIRDYYSAINGCLKMLYIDKEFYIAEDFTYQPWIVVMGEIPEIMTDEELFALVSEYIMNDKYIAVCTNIKKVEDILKQLEILTYHENFFVGCAKNTSDSEKEDMGDIRLATVSDLPFIEKTYRRSGHEQLLNRINAKQFWVACDGEKIKGYAGIHKDCSLGFQYVAEKYRRQRVGSRLQKYVEEYMWKNGMIPYVMISEDNKNALERV